MESRRIFEKEIVSTIGASVDAASKLIPEKFIETGKQIAAREVARLVQKVYPMRFKR